MPSKPHGRTNQQTTLKRRADRGPGKRLTFADRYRILELHRANPDWSYVRLATECGVNPETARHTVLAASRSAVDLMQAYAAPMLEDWIGASRKASARGDHRPARDWLLHAGSIEPMPESTRTSGPAVVIINNPLPGMPGYVDTNTPRVLAAETTIAGETVAQPQTLHDTKT
jgi:hypothetical protein